MKFKNPQILGDIALLINAEFIGSKTFEILGINEIHVVEKGDIVFVDHPKYYDKALNSAATTILINKKLDCPEGKTLLISDDPFRDFNKITKHFNPFIASRQSISDTALIGQDTIIQPNVFIGNNVTIGSNCIIHPNVTIYDKTVIGNNVTIHANTVLGADAFYYKNRITGYDKLISGGRVVIKDNVDLGASCTIDRGVTGDTTIGEGTKIDNQVQIGHNCHIGENTVIAGCVGIAGSAVLGSGCKVGGAAMILGHLHIADKTTVSPGTMITKSIKKSGEKFTSIIPFLEHSDWLRFASKLKQFGKKDD